MITRTLTGIALLAALSACTNIPTNGNDTSFTRTGTLNCPEEMQIDPNLLGGTQDRPLRCGPQTQSMTQ